MCTPLLEPALYTRRRVTVDTSQFEVDGSGRVTSSRTKKVHVGDIVFTCADMSFDPTIPIGERRASFVLLRFTTWMRLVCVVHVMRARLRRWFEPGECT
jgi:hypothetical protein